MHFATLFALAGAVASVSATTLSRRQDGAPPACAIPCLTSTEAPFGACAPTENACLCNNAEFVAFGTQCVTDACEGADREAAFAFSREICAQVGVTLSSSAPEPTGEPSGEPSGEPTPSGSGTTGAPAPSGSPVPSGSGGSQSVSRSTGGSASSGAPSASTTAEPADDGSASNTRVSLFAVALGLAAFAL